MICRECDCCKKGWLKSKPNDYVCVGVYEPFVIRDINVKCTEYPDEEFKDEKCSLCRGDKNFKINSISTMNCTSSYATFDLGRMNNIKFCPECGRQLCD